MIYLQPRQHLRHDLLCRYGVDAFFLQAAFLLLAGSTGLACKEGDVFRVAGAVDGGIGGAEEGDGGELERLGHLEDAAVDGEENGGLLQKDGDFLEVHGTGEDAAFVETALCRDAQQGGLFGKAAEQVDGGVVLEGADDLDGLGDAEALAGIERVDRTDGDDGFAFFQAQRAAHELFHVGIDGESQRGVLRGELERLQRRQILQRAALSGAVADRGGMG